MVSYFWYRTFFRPTDLKKVEYQRFRSCARGKNHFRFRSFCRTLKNSLVYLFCRVQLVWRISLKPTFFHTKHHSDAKARWYPESTREVTSKVNEEHSFFKHNIFCCLCYKHFQKLAFSVLLTLQIAKDQLDSSFQQIFSRTGSVVIYACSTE